MTHSDLPLVRRPDSWTARQSRPFLVLGAIGVVGGGLLSAVLAPAASYVGNWAVAYLVLVGGAAQVTLGVSQTSVSRRPVTGRLIAAQVLLWNLGVAGTVAATVAGLPMLLYAAAAAQVVALALILVTTRGGRPGATLIALRTVAVILLVATPIGVILQAVT